MKKNIITKSGIVLFSSILLVSCNSTNEIDVDVHDTDSTEITNNDVEEDNKNRIDYSVPTPNELFSIIKDLGGKLNIELINDVENKEKYLTNGSKAINFGVYSADIGYMSCFDHNIDFIRFTKVIEELGNDLGIAEVFDQALMDRIMNNDGNGDSLFVISNDTYYDNYQYLEENEKGTELALIISGGYIESLYIVSNLLEKYDEKNPIIEKIGDQKLVLENIIDFCGEYMDDPAVSEMINDLMDLNETFDLNMTFIESEVNTTTDEEGVTTLSGGGHFEMNKEAFNAIKAKINELRTKITQK